MKLNIFHNKKLSNINPVVHKTIKTFIIYCIQQLNLEGDVNVYLLTKNNPHKITTAGYNPLNKKVMVKAENRACVDICRSIAHELVHQRQDELGDLKDTSKIPDIGGEIEDEANAIAGQLVKMFVKDNDAKFIYDL